MLQNGPLLKENLDPCLILLSPNVQIVQILLIRWREIKPAYQASQNILSPNVKGKALWKFL